MDTLQKHREELLHYLMTFIGGFMGLYAICAHGSFGSAQTGNLMNLLIDLSDGNGFSAMARIGAFVIFSSGIAVSWLMHEFCSLPMRELCILVDAAALMLSVWLPEELFSFFRIYPLFFATSFQWGSFNHVGKYPSATLFLTGNLKNCITRWLKYSFYKDVQDLIGARIYTLTILSYLLGGSLGCAAVGAHSADGAYWAFAPLTVAAWVLWQEHHINKIRTFFR